MRRWGGFGWVGGAALVMLLSNAGCGDDKRNGGGEDTAAAETMADSIAGDTAADVTANPETVDTAVAETDTAVPTDTADAAQDSQPVDTAPDTTPADTAPDTAIDTTPADTAPDTAGDTTAVDTTPAEVDPGLVTWDDVYPIFSTSCTPCHAGASPTAGSGGHAIASPNKAVAYDASQLSADLAKCAGKTIGECALIRIQDGSMPATGDCQDPVKAKCPDVDEQALIQQWITDGMLE